MKAKIKATEIKQLSNHAGFTMIEIMVAICILTIALVEMAALTEMVIKSNSFSRDRTTATTLAKSQLEDLKNTAFLNLVNGTDYATVKGVVQAAAAGSYFTRNWVINTNTPATGSTTITSQVIWNRCGSARNVTLQTIRTAK